MKNTLFIIVSFLLISSTAFAWYSADELEDFQQGRLRDAKLKKAIFKTVSEKHVPMDYKKAKQLLFKTLHGMPDKDGILIEDVYCNHLFRYGSGGVNLEHTWPRSQFSKDFKKNTQKGDLHHLFPVNTNANGKRGNDPFAFVDGMSALKDCDASLVGEALDEDGFGADVFAFEPPDSHKGNVARAMFYFSVRYKLRIDRLQEYTFRVWNLLDPVDEEEVIRNDLIEENQGNRNPFIDFPYLGDQIHEF